jgi:hypothetical protein
MNEKMILTYPVASSDHSEGHLQEEDEVLFDAASRSSYFRSLEKAQQNLGLVYRQKKKEKLLLYK